MCLRLRLYGCIFGRPDVLDRIKLRTITNQLSIIVNIFIPWKYCGRTASFKLEPVTFSVYLMKYDIRILVLRCEIISAAAVCIAMQCKANSFR